MTEYAKWTQLRCVPVPARNDAGPMSETSALTPTILIVDDDAEMRLFLRTLLINGGHRVLDASNGRDALMLCRAAHPELVMTDVKMPGMDGYELVRQLRNERAIASTRIIFVTGTLKAKGKQPLATKCGVRQVLHKPCTPAGVLKAVNAALSAPAPATRFKTGFDRHHASAPGKNELGTANSRFEASGTGYLEMFESHPEPMCVLDADSLAFLGVNDAAVRFYGYRREEFLAQPSFEILPTEQIAAAIGVFRESGGGAGTAPSVGMLYRQGGNSIEVELTAHEVRFQGRPAYSVVVRDVTERNRKEREFDKSEEQLRLLAGRLQKVREEERAFLARELHDDLGQSMTAIKMDLWWLAAHRSATTEEISARIVSSLDLADRTIAAARRLASGLGPAILDLGLQAAIEWQVQEFRQRANIRCKLEFALTEIPFNSTWPGIPGPAW